MRARDCGPSEGLLHTPSAGTHTKKEISGLMCNLQNKGRAYWKIGDNGLHRQAFSQRSSQLGL